MANTLTAIAPQAYTAVSNVANEPTIIIDGINTDFDDKGVAVGDTIDVPYAPAATVAAYTPAMTTTAGTDKTAAAVEVSITDSNQTSWNLTGEQQRSLENAETNRTWIEELLAQGMRALRNDVESTAWTAIYKASSRAVGTAGTTPFASSLDILSDLRQVLSDNGAPLSDMYLAINSAAASNLQKLDIFQQANLAGTEAERRTGTFSPQYGFKIGQSAQITTHTKGTGTGYLIDNAAGEAVGQTTLTLDTGTGTMLAGDVITIAGDSDKYVVNTALASGDVVIGNPGLRTAAADDAAVTIGDSYTANLGWERSAVVGVVRPPVIPPNANIQTMPISDPNSGLTYLLAQIQGDGMVTWRLHLAYGFKVVQSAFVATLLG